METKIDLTPKQIVSELDQYIIGQNKAKRAVAVALRNRERRCKLPEEIRDAPIFYIKLSECHRQRVQLNLVSIIQLLKQEYCV